MTIVMSCHVVGGTGRILGVRWILFLTYKILVQSCSSATMRLVAPRLGLGLGLGLGIGLGRASSWSRRALSSALPVTLEIEPCITAPRERPTPVLFARGPWHSAWAWESTMHALSQIG